MANTFWLKIQFYLKMVFDSPIVRLILSLDVTPIFLFFALILFGYELSLLNFLGSIGLWKVCKESIKYIFTYIGRLK